VFFVEKRKQRHVAQGVKGARIVTAFAVATITGTLVATLTMLVANRLLPSDLPHRGDFEERCFWLAWGLALAHGALRTAAVETGRIVPAWREQCWAVAGLAPLAVLLNWVTTGDHLLATVSEGYWPVAGLDFVLLVVGAIAAWSAVRLRRQERSTQAGPTEWVSGPLAPAEEATHG
jgi:hypothetical protein